MNVGRPDIFHENRAESPLYLGRAPRTKETLPDFREKCRVARHSRVFRRLTDSQQTPGIWGVIVKTVTGSINDTHIPSPYRLTNTQCKCQWETNPESIPTLITHLEVYVITITVCILFGQQSFSDYTAGLLHPHRTFRITPRVSYTRTELLAHATGLLHPY